MRDAGYAWGLEEFAEGIDSIAAPIRDARGNAIAAIHVHGPSYRFPAPRSEARVAAAMTAGADEVSRRLAGDAALTQPRRLVPVEPAPAREGATFPLMRSAAFSPIIITGA